MISIAFVTYEKAPDGTPDDRMTAQQLAAQGVEVCFVIWDDPNVAWSSFPVSVIRSTWDYHLKPERWFAWLKHASGRTRLINDADLLRWNSDKAYLLELAARGVATVPTHIVAAGETIAQICGQRGWRDIVIKPAIGASANDVARFAGAAIGEDAEHLGARLARTTGALVQPFQSGVLDERERSLVFLGGAFSHAVSKPPFSAGAAAGVRQLPPHRASPAEIELARAAIAAAPSQPLYARIDVVPTPSGPFVMEAEFIEPDLALGADDEARKRFVALILALARRPSDPHSRTRQPHVS